MARNLYRFYLYIIFIAMLILAAVGLEMLLQQLFALTPLRGGDTIAPYSALVQAVVFAVVSWVIAILLGGSHYWLIRRDMRNDPAAGSGAVRAFFLNATEAISLPIGVALLSYVITQLGQVSFYGVPSEMASAIAALGLFTLLELERRRTQAGSGAAIVFQRLHFYGVQLVLLFILTPAWLTAVNQLLDSALFGGKGWGMSMCSGPGACQGPNLFTSTASALWVVLFWIGYGFFTRSDTYSLLRQILHFFSVAYGVGFVLVGIKLGIELASRTLFGASVPVTDLTGSGAMYAFVPLITLGLLTLAVYSIWLRDEARPRPTGQVTTFLVSEAITTTLMAAAFWWGIGLVLLNTMESIATPRARPGAQMWAAAFAFVITGLAYILLDIHLRRRSVQVASTGPRRGFVFILLGGGIVAGAVGALILLYNVLTSLLGSPADNWQHMARVGSAALIVGLLIVGVYLWIATREGLLGAHKTVAEVEAKEPSPATVPAPVPTTEEPVATAVPATLSIEDVLDELQAGKITRDEAAARIRELTGM